jgi:hypothetical protein
MCILREYEIMADEIAGDCSTHGRDEERIQSFDRKMQRVEITFKSIFSVEGIEIDSKWAKQGGRVGTGLT